MIFLRGNASYLYSTVVTTRGPRKKPRERSGFLEDDSNGFGKIPSTRESLWEGFPKVIKVSANSQSQSDSSLWNPNIVFRFWQLSSNSAKPPRATLCGFALSPELSNTLRFGPNNIMSRVDTESLLVYIFRDSGN